MRKLWFLPLVLALCGCQQKPAAPPPQQVESAPVPTAAPAPAADSRPLIACFGDSLTAGAGLDDGQTYPDLLQHDLDQRGYRYRVLNFGESGDTTQDGLARLGSVVAERPAIVLLELGANDGLRGQPVSNAANNLGRIIEAFQSARVPVVLAGITLPPNYGPQYIQSFEAMYRTLAARYKLPLIPFLLEGVGGHQDLMQRDGLHPNAAGTHIVEGTVFRALEPLLRKD
jgi:acyl-CoA thioesterase I